jgi:hypothetical protein
MNTNPNASLSIVELEDRFETTVAALDSARCGDGATVKVEVSAV